MMDERSTIVDTLRGLYDSVMAPIDTKPATCKKRAEAAAAGVPTEQKDAVYQAEYQACMLEQ